MAELTDSELRSFAAAFVQLGQLAQAHAAEQADDSIATAVAQHLGVDSAELPSVGVGLADVDRPNLQLALNEILADQPDAEVIGLSPELAHYGGFSLSSLIAGRFRGPAEMVPVVWDNLPVDVDETLRCAVAGLWLVKHDGTPVVIATSPGERGGPPQVRNRRLEIFATEEAIAAAVLDDLNERRQRLNVYRHKVLAFAFSEFGEFGISFMARPTTTRDEVILPEGDLHAVIRHAVGLSEHAEAMTAAGQHLKRGLLLYGPPGTGKTHTIGHLLHAMPDRTTVILQGPSVGALGQAAAIVRGLTPSTLVIEDVDLIATERSMHPMGGSQLMFQLLNEMDGLTVTDDVLFVLTTNRLDILEPALAARPGRIDQAVEIGLPDAAGRRKLLELYLADVDRDVTSLDDAVERTEGVTASFMKELVRRCVFEALDTGDGTVHDVELATALDELLERRSPILASMLGQQPPDPRFMPGPPMTGGTGMTGFRPAPPPPS